MRTHSFLHTRRSPAGHATRTQRHIVLASITALLLIVSWLMAALPIGAAPAHAPDPAPLQSTLPATTCLLNAGVRTCDLWAKTGTLTVPGPVTVPIWGYSATSGGTATLPGPLLVVNQGDVVNIVLHNTLSEASSLSLPAYLPPDSIGAAAGASKTYIFTASQSGTYLYQAGLTSNGHTQVAMGLYGALIVRPTGCANCAYGAANTYDDEALLVLSEIDPAFNAAPATFNLRNYAPKYWLLNGKAYPNTDPISTAGGRRVLLRYVNAGLENYSLGLLGIHQTVLANDGKLYPFTYRVVAETIPAGATLDTIATVPGSTVTRNYALYNQGVHLDNNGATTGGIINFGGMLTFLTAGAGNPPANQPPLVNAGLDQTITLPASATLDGTVTDDGLPSGTLTTLWTQQSGPGTVTFGNANAVDTTASFSAAGSFVLRLTASDGTLSAFDEATITVNPVPPAQLYFSTFGNTNPPSVGGTADDADIYFWNGTAFSRVIDASAAPYSLPASGGGNANVDGFDRVDATHFYMSFNGQVNVPGIGNVQDEDIVYYSAGTWSLYFDGSANGLSGGSATDLDAISIVGGTLYFSTDNTAVPPGAGGTGDDADIYRWNGGSSYTRLYDASALGWSTANVDGFVQVDPTHFYMSYSADTTVPGLSTVQDEDVVYYNNGTWSVYFDGTAQGLTNSNQDLDAFDLP